MLAKSFQYGLTIAVVLLSCLTVSPLRLYALAEGRETDSIGQLTARKSFEEDEQRLLELTDGPMTPYMFSYELSPDVQRMKIYCERSSCDQETETVLLIERDFVDAPDSEPRRGEIFISEAHHYVSIRDIYHKDMNVMNADGKIIGVKKGTEVFGWDTAEYPLWPEKNSNAPTLNIHAYYTSVMPDDGRDEGEGVLLGERVNMLLLVKVNEMEVLSRIRHAERDAETLWNEIKGSENMATCVFYCVIE